MKSMHGFHMFRNVQPPVSKVVEWFNDEHVCQESINGTIRNACIVGKEHARKNELQCDLCPHVKHDANEVVFFFTSELLLCQFVVVVILIAT